MGRVRAVTDAGLDDALLEAPGAVVLSFWASWCAPCLTMAPVVTELAERFGDRLAFVSVDVDAEPNVPARYGVEEVPSYVVVHAGEVEAQCRVRSVQTNEPLRCAALLPALARIEGPIALIEVGASAGLCLYPDRYSYRYRRGDEIVALDPVDGPSAVELYSDLSGEPEWTMPEIVWRAGIDLTPLDAGDEDDRAWLAGLVWPGEEGRRERIVAALDVAAADPPLLVAGDGADALPALAAQAPPGATLVVTTPGVLAHVPRVRRGTIVDAARAAGRWITLDAPGLHDAWTTPARPDHDGFRLALDGEILADVDPLGAWVAWHPGRTAPAQ